MVVDDDDVEGEGCLLRESRADGILDGAFAVADGDDDGGFDGELAFREVHFVVLVAVQVGIEGAEVTCTSPFHLHLTGAVAGVDIVELLLSAQPGVAFHLGVEELVDVQRQLLAADVEPEVVEACVLVVVEVFLSDVLLQHLRTEEQHGAHLEVIANGAELVVDEH